MPDERPRLGGILPTMSTPDLPIIMAPNTLPATSLLATSLLASSLLDDDSSLDKPADGITPIPSSSSMPELQEVGEEWAQFGVTGSPAKQPEDGE
jgi:hypothetical protein